MKEMESREKQMSKKSTFFCIFFPASCQMPGSSGLTQSMKKTIGHRGVETTTGETTYKKVRSVAAGVVFTSCLESVLGLEEVPQGAPSVGCETVFLQSFSFLACRPRHRLLKAPSSWASLTPLAAWARRQRGTFSCRILWWLRASSSPGGWWNKSCVGPLNSVWYFYFTAPLFFFFLFTVKAVTWLLPTTTATSALRPMLLSPFVTSENSLAFDPMTTWLALTLLLFTTTADVTDLVTLTLQPPKWLVQCIYCFCGIYGWIN